MEKKLNVKYFQQRKKDRKMYPTDKEFIGKTIKQQKQLVGKRGYDLEYDHCYICGCKTDD